MNRTGLCFTVMATILLISTITHASTYTSNPVADTFVLSSMPNSNFGSETGLATGYTVSNSPYPIWHTYLKFAMPAIPGSEVITGATLYLNQFDGAGFASLGTLVYRLPDDTWTESTLTWNNSVSSGSYGTLTLIGQNSNGNTYRGWSSYDLIANGAWQPGAEDGYLSLLLREIQSGDQSHNFYSKEYSDSSLHPYLVITTTAVPIPGAVWLLGSGLLGLVAIRRKFKK